MFGERKPRDLILFGLTAVVALLLISSFLTPHGAFEVKEVRGVDRLIPDFGGKKADWHFGWSVEGLWIFVSILNLLVGAAIAGLLFVKLPKLIKAIAMVGSGLFLMFINTLNGMTSGFSGYPEKFGDRLDDMKERIEKLDERCADDSERACEMLERAQGQLDGVYSEIISGGRPSWFLMLITGMLIALAVGFALNSDSGGKRSWRTGLGILAGGAMLSIAVLPFPMAPFDMVALMTRGGFESGAVRPGSAFIDLSPWAFGDHEFKFKELMYLYARTGVLALGPAAGILLIFHSIFAMVRPEKALRNVGAIAGVVFALWLPACYFIADQPLIWSEDVSIPITHSLFFAAPALYGAVIGIGALHLGDAFAESPDLKARVVGTLKKILYGVVPNGTTVGAPVSMSAPVSAPAPSTGPAAGTQPQGPPAGQGPSAGAPEAGGFGGGSPLDDMGHDATAAIDLSQLDAVVSGDRQSGAGGGGMGMPEAVDGATAAIDVYQIDALMQADRKGTGGGGPPAGGGMGMPEGDGATAAIDVSQIDALMQSDRKKKGGDEIGLASTATWDSGTFGDVINAANQARNKTEIQKHLDAGSKAWYAEDWATARSHYEAILMLDAEHLDALRAVAELYYYEGDLDASEQYYKRVLAISPHDEASLEALRQIVRYRQGG